MYYSIAPELPLNSHCDEGDVCDDTNSGCRSFTCLCNDNFFERYQVCCKYDASECLIYNLQIFVLLMLIHTSIYLAFNLKYYKIIAQISSTEDIAVVAVLLIDTYLPRHTNNANAGQIYFN